MWVKNFGLRLFSVTAITTMMVSGHETSLWDVIPVTAQIKSLFQLVVGDPKGAAKTQLSYLNEGVGPAQLRSAYFLVTGEAKKALDIQEKSISNLEGLIDGLPVVGHIKGGIHLLAGDRDHGWEAIKAATSTTGAVVGATVLGPLGAIAGHLSADMAITISDVLLNGNESHPHGFIEYFKNIQTKDAGEHFDALAGLALDGMTGTKIKTKTGSFDVHKTVKYPSEIVRGISYKALLQAEAEDSLLEDQQSMVKWKDDSSDSQETQFTEKENPVEKEEIELKTLDKQVESPNIRAESPVIRVETPDIQVESTDIRKSSPDLWVKRDSSDEHEETPGALKVTEIDEEKRTNFYKSNNKMKLKTFIDFLQNDQFYSHFNFARFTFRELEKNKFNGLDKFADNNELNKIDVDAMTSKLDYLTDDEKSLITINDFRTVNKDVVETDTVLSSLAGVMREDVTTLQKMLSKKPKKSYDPKLDIAPKSYLKELNKRKKIGYYYSDELSGLKELNDLLLTHSKFLENKKLILVETAGEEEGNAFVLKTKKVAGNPEPVKLFIDYQLPGFVRMGSPNPFRFTTYLEDPNSTYRVYVVGVVGSK